MANVPRATIVGILLHQAESKIAAGDTVNLQNIPAYILVKLDRTWATCLSDLED